MLLWLHIKNVALIEEAEIEFTDGLNVLSGETGAGKSMIIDSINFVLGERTSKNFIRTGEQKAQVQAGFSFCDKGLSKELEDLGIDVEDQTIIIQRVMTAEGKSTARINGTVVTAGMIKQISENLIDIHGQHEHQSLLNASKHIEILDKFALYELEGFKAQLTADIKVYKEVLRKLKEVSGDDFEREEKIEKLEYKINEIDNAELKENEENDLVERKNYLNNIDKIMKLSRQCEQLFYLGTDENNSAIDSINETQRLLSTLADIDESAKDMYENICILGGMAEEIGRNLKSYTDILDDGTDEIDSIEERLDLIYKLKKKYGASILDILKFRDKANSELNFILNSEEERKKLDAEKKKIHIEIKDICDKMSNIRIEKSNIIAKDVEKQLQDLQMKNASFDIIVTQKETFNSNGRDSVEFLISPNIGEDLKPLAKIASGGEMSRVMLAMKTIVAKVDAIDTLIFDEIDTGISGNTASRVGEKMSLISIEKQVLCITHLPQIASMADSHFLIEKYVCHDKTKTSVTVLDMEGRIKEISRLMGGDISGGAVKEAAKEMLQKSRGFKKSNLVL